MPCGLYGGDHAHGAARRPAHATRTMHAMNTRPDAPSLRTGPAALVHTLAWLRLFAIAGQSITVLAATEVLGLTLALPLLYIGIGALAVFELAAIWWLYRPGPVHEWEAVGHVAVDTLVLSYLLYFTGGATNPFISLLLVPIALSATAVSKRGIMAVATLAALAYVVLLKYHVPLPTPDANPDYQYRLYVAGIAVNFVIMGLLLGVFIQRLAAALRAQHAEVQHVRERALRDEGILAIATQAAGVAHEMNTPLSTMRTLLAELRRDHATDYALREDLFVLETQVERCRASLREMVAVGKAQLANEPESLRLDTFVQSCLERFRLLRPEADVDLHLVEGLGDMTLEIQTGLRHALLNLLNNAADASAQNNSTLVTLRVESDGDWLVFSVGDQGPGFTRDNQLTRLGHTRKRTGLGLGLALVEATTERLAGELEVSNTGHGGEIHVRLPLSALHPT